jgi:hypothetical protein
MLGSGHWWLTPVILATQRQRSGGSWFKASPGKWFMSPYLKKTLYLEWLKVQASVPQKKTILGFKVLICGSDEICSQGV